MRAAVFKGIGQPLSIETRPDPAPGAGEMALRVGRCGVCGIDTVPLESLPGAFEALRRRTRQCKVLVDPTPP